MSLRASFSGDCSAARFVTLRAQLGRRIRRPRKPRPSPTRAIPAPSDICRTCPTAVPSSACRSGCCGAEDSGTGEASGGGVAVDAGVSTGSGISGSSCSGAAWEGAISLGDSERPGRTRPSPASRPASRGFLPDGPAEDPAPPASATVGTAEREGTWRPPSTGCEARGRRDGGPGTPVTEGDVPAEGPAEGSADGSSIAVPGVSAEGVAVRATGCASSAGASARPSGPPSAYIPAVSRNTAPVVSARPAARSGDRADGDPVAMGSGSHERICPASGTQPESGPHSPAGSPVDTLSSKWAPRSAMAVPADGNWSTTCPSAYVLPGSSTSLIVQPAARAHAFTERMSL